MDCFPGSLLVRQCVPAHVAQLPAPWPPGWPFFPSSLQACGWGMPCWQAACPSLCRCSARRACDHDLQFWLSLPCMQCRSTLGVCFLQASKS